MKLTGVQQLESRNLLATVGGDIPPPADDGTADGGANDIEVTLEVVEIVDGPITFMGGVVTVEGTDFRDTVVTIGDSTTDGELAIAGFFGASREYHQINLPMNAVDHIVINTYGESDQVLHFAEVPAIIDLGDGDDFAMLGNNGVHDVLFGGAGNDTVYSWAPFGEDDLDGGPGNDTLFLVMPF